MFAVLLCNNPICMNYHNSLLADFGQSKFDCFLNMKIQSLSSIFAGFLQMFSYSLELDIYNNEISLYFIVNNDLI